MVGTLDKVHDYAGPMIAVVSGLSSFITSGGQEELSGSVIVKQLSGCFTISVVALQ